MDLVLGAADVASTGDLGLSGIDSALALPTDSATALTSAADAATSTAAPSSSDLAQLLNELIGQPLQTLEQDWITSSTGQAFDSELNSLFGMDLIGNGANGVGGETLADADGGNGGMWFGDGGNGATDAAGVGGSGGNAAEI